MGNADLPWLQFAAVSCCYTGIGRQCEAVSLWVAANQHLQKVEWRLVEKVGLQLLDLVCYVLL